MKDSLHVISDTNIFLHYPPLSQIDWRTLCDASNVHLVICLQVIHELDEKKSDSRLAERAIRAIKEIRAASDTGQPLREGVILSVFNQELRQSDFSGTLSPDSGDDRIVHLARMYRDHNPGQEVAVVTEDFGMELRCKAGGVSVVRMDPAMRLPNPQDELTRKYKQAITELNSLKNRFPRLTLRLSAVGSCQTPEEDYVFELPDSWPLTDIDGELNKAKENYPKQTGLINAGALPPMAGMFVSQEEWREYDQRLDEFYANYRTYLQQCDTLTEAKARSIMFDLWLCNTGSGPAEDIDADVTIPTQVKWIAQKGTEEAKLFEKPQPPKPPEKPKPFVSLLQPLDLVLPRIVPRARSTPDEQQPKVIVQKQADQSHVIHARLQKLKHGHNQHLGEFYAVFGCWKDGQSFQAPFSISTSELPDRVTGRIPFVIRVRTSHT